MMHSPQSEAPFLPAVTYLPEDSAEQKYQIEKSYVDIALNVNAREIATYDLTEGQTGQAWFISGDITKKRLGYRKCYTATTAGAVTNIPHGITDIAQCRITHMYGTMQNSPFTAAVPIPQGGAAPIALSIGAVNITINDAAAAFVGYIAYVVIEFVRDR